jgi:hypothetical protein
LKLDTLVMIQTKFGFHCSSTFRGEDFWKSLRRKTDDDDGRQVMAIAQLTLWVRWAKKQLEVILCILIIWWIPPKNQTISWCSLNWRHSMKSTHLLQLYNKMYFSRRKFSQSSRFDINTISKIRLLMYTLTSLSQHISYELRKILLVLNCPSQKRPPLLFSHFSLRGLIKRIQLSTVKPV